MATAPSEDFVKPTLIPGLRGAMAARIRATIANKFAAVMRSRPAGDE